MTTQIEATGPASSTSETDQPPSGIGGWLIIPAIGLVLGALIGVPTLIFAMVQFDDVVAAGYGGIYAMEIVVQLFLLGLLFYAGIRFFQTKRDAPDVVSTLLLLSVGASVLLLVIELTVGAQIFAMITGRQLVRDIISAAIWVPYFRVSKRVRATFVN